MLNFRKFRHFCPGSLSLFVPFAPFNFSLERGKKGRNHTTNLNKGQKMTITKTLTSVSTATLMKRLRKVSLAPVANRRCSCRDKQGRLKRLYVSPSEAADIASTRMDVTQKWLKIYECPEKLGWHITSNVFQW